MIRLTGLNGKEFYLNAEYIEKIEANPDTTITLFNGKKYIVAEPVEEVVKRVLEYKKKIILPPRPSEE
ncbi:MULTISPECIES: flagellar FlbD family protein [Fervidobacterium]|uniref:Flagellar FlbD family protein n=1 Tax=Fervidobacterium nodosum (strain ATCC 35602 / DSM 5306 / Rt17-B1) TaxID=381764 RepID=A7HN96_FERNB|nr:MULTISPECIES: flagellar FlbD family protein [Fervidobacterium]ABS61379.1 flagellar FlbD family protein [Fervidobacterium nodosum Rt17-B1]KAF2962174.1 flagellar protein [Fervidobacterium sp. 2310opik-2]PHJ14018.1 flagellar protein [Fervidobacterium sp. SC_NGM5_G05]